MTPKSDHEDEMSMEEILASIRKFVTDNPQDIGGTSNPGAIHHEPIPQSITQAQQAYYPEFENAPQHVHEPFPAMTPEHHHAVLRSTMVDGANNHPGHHPAPQYPQHAHHPVPESSFDSDILELTTPLNPTPHNPISAPAPQHTPWNPPSRSQTQKKALEDSIMTLTNPIGGKKVDMPTRDAMKAPSIPDGEENLGSSKTVSASASSLSRLAQASKNAPKRAHHTLADQRSVTLDQMIQDLIRPMIKQWIDNHLPSLVEEMVAKEIKRITKHLG